jgi:hypothetical protein
VVDSFFCLAKDLWLPSNIHLPENLKNVFTEFSFLHGALEQPEHHTTPEQLLELLEAIKE